MAKAKNGKDKALYPKLLRISEYSKNDKGQGTATKIKVNSVEEENDARKKYKVLDNDTADNDTPAGWGKK